MDKPPFKITSSITKNCQIIEQHLKVMSGLQFATLPIRLRKINNIKTIQSSLAIEGNTLTVNQVTAILEGKKVIAPQKDILEVKNAIQLYQNISIYDPLSPDDLLAAHHILMINLITECGKWRHSKVGIYKDNQLTHLAPPADRVPFLMENLFSFLKDDLTTSWLIKAFVFHYELEFIHPFEDGNGRIGRLWQQLILTKHHPIFQYIAVEALIHDHQQEYYQVLSDCDQQGCSTAFIEFSQHLIIDALKRLHLNVIDQDSPKQRLLQAELIIQTESFDRKYYRIIHPALSSATASRDLMYGVQQKTLTKQGHHNTARYYFTRHTLP